MSCIPYWRRLCKVGIIHLILRTRKKRFRRTEWAVCYQGGSQGWLGSQCLLSFSSSLDNFSMHLFCVVFNPQFHCFGTVVLSLDCPFSITWDGVWHEYFLKLPWWFLVCNQGVRICLPQAWVFGLSPVLSLSVSSDLSESIMILLLV